MRLDEIGFWRGVSCVIGLLGTIAYHKSLSTMSLEATGEWSIIAQFTCLLLCYFSLFVTSNGTSLAMLIGGTCLSRVGLWVFDMTVTQMMQLGVPEAVRGVVGGVQESLYSGFGLFTFLLGIVFPDPRDFHYFVEMGCLSVGSAMILFTFGVYMRREKPYV